MSLFARVRAVLAAGFLLSVAAAGAWPSISEDRRALAANAHDTDLVTRETSRYRDLIGSLPSRGTIGFLAPTELGATEATASYYLAQYALTPRVVIVGTDAEFVIAIPESAPQGDDAPGTMSPDPRLPRFTLVRTLGNGIRIYRRVP
jgi:hypothetical protein